jgi:hypothetical protein
MKKIIFACFLGLFWMPAISQNVNTVCGDGPVQLFIQAPAGASWQWEQSTDGTNFTVAFANSLDTITIQPNPGTVYYRTRISDGNCTPYYSDIEEVTIVAPPTPATAGPNQVVPGTSATLAGNSPTNGVGTWTIVSGTGGNLANPNLHNTTFTGQLGVIYTLAWTIENAPCAPTSDTVTVEFGSTPPPPPVPTIQCNNITLYIHPTDNGTGVQWGCVGIVTGATDDWNGRANTTLIVNNCTAPTAGHLCDNLTAFGFSDWYLPANNQLDCMRNNATAIGGFANTGYWSSTEGASFLSANARMRTFPSGLSGVSSKSNSHNVRCVRD